MTEFLDKMLAEKGIEGTFLEARRVARDYVYKLREQGRISFSEPRDADLPSVHIVRRTVPEAWEDMSMAIMGIGSFRHTHYDPGHEKGKYTSFPSTEVTGILHIEEPFGEPRFHKHFLGGWKGFGDYKAEIEGVKDCMVMDPKIVVNLLRQGEFDKIKEHKGWLYSYSQRIRTYPFIDIEGNCQTINQIQAVIEKLAEDPTSKSAQCVTWDPRFDNNDGQMKYRDKEGNQQKAIFTDYHSPCLQSLWFRLGLMGNGNFRMNMNSRFRSHCHLKGLPSNFYGLLEVIYEPIRLGIQEATGKTVERGRLVNTSDSLHVYGHYLDTRMQGKDAEAYLEDVFRVARGEPIEDRLIIPGTPMHEIMAEEVKQEYDFRKANPLFGMNM